MADNLSNVVVGADVKFPTHDVSLTDIDGKQAGLILCNRNGIKDPTQLKMSAMPRTPMQMTQGSAGYDDMELPFVAEVQTTMTGGRGSETLSSDRTKFFDSFRLDTTKEYPICAPAVVAQTGIAPTGNLTPCSSSPNFYTIGIGSIPILFQYTFAAQTIVTGITINTSSSTYSEVELYYSILAGASNPTWETNNEMTEMMYTAHLINLLDGGTECFLPCSPTTVNAGENLYVILFADKQAATRIGTGVGDGATYYSAIGLKDWNLELDNTFLKSTIHTVGEFTVKLFEYKRQLYAVMNETNKDFAKLFMNGWRGVADANTGAPSTLKDSTQTGWADDAAKGCIVLIINGKGEHEDQPWRRVISSASGVLTVSSPWKIVHDTTTQYVVLGSDTWAQIDTTRGSPEVNYLSQAVTSIAVVGNEVSASFVVFAFGQTSSDPVLSYYGCGQTGADPDGVFTDSFSVDTAAKADILMPIVNEQGKLKLWRADCDDCTVDYASLPASGVPTTLNFDINAELRADLTLQRDRLYYSLWEELTNSGNDTLLQLTRMRDNLTVEGTRLIGATATVAATITAETADTLVGEAAARYRLSTENKLATARAAEDYRLEAYRIIGGGTIASPTTYIDYSGSTRDSLLKTANASGTAAEKTELTNRVYQLIGNKTIDQSIADGAVVSITGAATAYSLIRKALIDAQAASDLYDIADAELTELKNRAIDIVGATGTVTSPSAISGTGATTIYSELQRVTTDITAEQNRLTLAAGIGSDLMRQILDLTYQIGVNSAAVATESEDSARNAIDFPWTAANPDLAAHTDNVNSVAHKYLPANIKCGSTSSRITNIVPYGTPVIPYIMKEDSFGSISDNIYQEIPLAELKSVRAEDNGKTAMHYGVYLYFNLEGGRIERYFDQRIDDVGFNRDEGLPRERQGEVSKLVPYPGRFYAACNAGFSGYSTVMCNNGMGWHEIYRSGTAGLRITDIYIQPIPGNEYADRLWVSEGGDLVAMPIAITPLQQYQYNYFGYGGNSGKHFADYGYVETSWIDFELKDVNKYFHSITIFSDYSSDIKSHQEYDIKVWFKVDDEKSWTYAGNTRAYPNKEIELRYPINKDAAHNVSGKKIKFKIGMKPNQAYETPRLKAIVINGVLRMPVKQSWNATFLLEPMSDLRKKTVTNKTPVTTTHSTVAPYDAKLYKRLQDWANSKTHSTPLLMRTNDEISDNHYVFIDPMSIQNVTVQQVMGSGSGEKEYKHIATMTMYEV